VVKIKLDLEKIFLILFFALFLFLGNGSLFDNRLQHDFPYGYLASDTFQHQVRAQSIKDAGNYRNEASYIVMGVENSIGYYPPVIYDISIILSYLSGLEVYDTIYLLVFLFAGLASLVMYLIIRQFNKHVAMIALPISLLVFSGSLYTGFTWGHWPTILSQFFLICIFWYTSRINLEKSYIFLGIFAAATFMTHTSEALFAGFYLGLFLIASIIIAKKIDFGIIKNYIFGGIMALVIVFHFFVIFKNVWLPRQPFEFAVSKTWDNPTIYLVDFKLLLLFMVVGAIISLFFIKKSLVPALASLTMLLIGSGNYFGFREKAFQLRFLWPIFLSFLIAFGIYWLLKLIIKEWRLVYSMGIAIVIILVLAVNAVPFVPHYVKLESSGIMNRFHWQGLNWIAENTEKDSVIYFFYGDIYSQDALLRNSKRTHYQVVPEDFVDAVNNKEIRRFYDTELPGDAGGGAPYRNSFFSFGFGLDELPSEVRFGEKDICQFDYFVFDKVARQPVLAQYNLIIASELQNKDFVNVVFDNQVLFIMKNNNPGADCIEQGSF
jgi:hypothetical protein|tara:strand:+ start:6298 stop:7941 length:1644 start_codon:yes stop_codon:yes gene_type:complete